MRRKHSVHMATQTLKYEVKFLTPAFLGNEDKSGQWRTPPFKALLRQWWRVAVAKEVGDRHKDLREREAKLFGHAWLENDLDSGGQKAAARASKVRLRLDQWSCGNLTKERWPASDFTKAQVRSDLYLGFGPVDPPPKKGGGLGRGPALAHDAIEPSQKATLRILARDCGDEGQRLIDAMHLAHLFGTLGSRSRNGWGSLHVEPVGTRPPHPVAKELVAKLLTRVTRPIEQSLRTDWANALGTDERGLLVWLTEVSVDNWPAAVNEFARVLAQVRGEAKGYQPSQETGRLNGIHLLGYPAGEKWRLGAWGDDQRLASQLRFKLVSLRGELRGMAFHMPCSIPEPLMKKLRDDDRDWLRDNQKLVWRNIHRWLDSRSSQLRRLRDEDIPALMGGD